jgi:hypothetical protein
LINGAVDDSDKAGAFVGGVLGEFVWIVTCLVSSDGELDGLGNTGRIVGDIVDKAIGLFVSGLVDKTARCVGDLLGSFVGITTGTEVAVVGSGVRLAVYAGRNVDESAGTLLLGPLTGDGILLAIFDGASLGWAVGDVLGDFKNGGGSFETEADGELDVKKGAKSIAPIYDGDDVVATPGAPPQSTSSWYEP